MDASKKAFKEIFLFLEKNIKNKKNINATTVNLKEREIKGEA